MNREIRWGVVVDLRHLPQRRRTFQPRLSTVLEHTRRDAIHEWLQGFDNGISKTLPHWAKPQKVVVEWESSP